ncbi:hypothetical protein AUJ68_06895 [Candidatus Woesearchaeota archaeon CG1_02_57_44]|nr:MAG: hypothetical protein AUJ68_06895 [Candidatus Woesearchaeota archaeon CG1_02_57_44]
MYFFDYRQQQVAPEMVMGAQLTALDYAGGRQVENGLQSICADDSVIESGRFLFHGLQYRIWWTKDVSLNSLPEVISRNLEGVGFSKIDYVSQFVLDPSLWPSDAERGPSNIPRDAQFEFRPTEEQLRLLSDTAKGTYACIPQGLLALAWEPLRSHLAMGVLGVRR